MSDGRRPLIAGNWKMNGLRTDALALADGVAAGLRARARRCDVLVCPPHTTLAAVAARLDGSGVAVGGQDCHAEAAGAFTGDVSAPMLRDAGASHVIVGHSERRQGHDESDETVRRKADAAISAGLVAVVCIGETLEQYEAGQTADVLRAQVAGSLPDAASPETVVIAYEPVWAIGSGRTPEPAEIGTVHEAIRRALDETDRAGGMFRILYGGSVAPSNAAAILSVAGVDGALVGGASLHADRFLAIVDSCG